MRFASTRDSHHVVGFSRALLQGLAPDGGLYVPTAWPPRLPLNAEPTTFGALATEVLRPLLGDDPLLQSLPAITREAFNFPVPLVALGPGLAVLELFHGPTAAFKDFGARFLAAAMKRLLGAAGKPLKILVATSGDTGGAVAAAFHRQPGVEVAVLYPRGLVSPTQQRQLTCWDGNVRSFEVRGSFDDCQRLVKQAFLDASVRARFQLSSANSINLGRLLPQMAYYFLASLDIQRAHGQPASFVIPSGNLGNATACVWARKLGAPIAAIVLAHNANRAVPDYLRDGVWQPRSSVATLASEMDVGNPSNFERLSALFPDAAALRGALSAVSVDDVAIAARIRTDFQRFGQVWCPHTAAAAEAYAMLPEDARRDAHWVLVATAHPAKFREVVEPLIGRKLAVPENLARLFERPTHVTEIEPQLEALKREL